MVEIFQDHKGSPKCPVYLGVCHEGGNLQPRGKEALGAEEKEVKEHREKS